MREPPLGLEDLPHPALEVFFDEVLAAPTTAELLVGLYEKALPALDAALARHAADTNPLADAPSVRVCRFARLEVGDMIDFGKKCVACLVDADARAAMAPWLRLLDDCLAAAGGLHGADTPTGQNAGPAALAYPLRLRPGAAPRRAVRGPVQPGRQRRGVPVQPGVPAAAEDAHDAVQAAARDRRAGDDGEHPVRDEGQAVGVLPRHDAAAVGRGPARHDGARSASRRWASTGRRRASRTTGRCG